MDNKPNTRESKLNGWYAARGLLGELEYPRTFGGPQLDRLPGLKALISLRIYSFDAASICSLYRTMRDMPLIFFSNSSQQGTGHLAFTNSAIIIASVAAASGLFLPNIWMWRCELLLIRITAKSIAKHDTQGSTPPHRPSPVSPTRQPRVGVWHGAQSHPRHLVQDCSTYDRLPPELSPSRCFFSLLFLFIKFVSRPISSRQQLKQVIVLPCLPRAADARSPPAHPSTASQEHHVQ